MTTENPNTASLQIGNEQLNLLHGILAEEIYQYEAVSERLTHKSQVLAANKPKQLAQLDRELLALSRKATQLEQERQRTMAKMGCPNWSLTELIAHLPPQQASRFTQSRERLRQAVKNTAALNRDNRDLLDLSLKWIQETVDIISSALAPEGASYTAQGGKNTPHNTSKAASPLQSTISHSA